MTAQPDMVARRPAAEAAPAAPVRMSHAVAERRCLFPDQLPAYLRSRYRAFALISDVRHLDRLDPRDDDTLIVCCDWLMWHRLIEEGRHAVFYELGILDWRIADRLATDFFNHANDWVLDAEGGDPTKFRSVSLGLLFGAEMSMAVMNYYRLQRSLTMLIERFKPAEIRFFDFKYDINHLSLALRRWIVEAVARERGIIFIDERDRPAGGHDAAVAIYRHKNHGPFRYALVSLYATLLEKVSVARRVFSPKDDRVLVLVNSNMAEPLVRGYAGDRPMPIFLGRTIPRKPGLLWHCLRRGVTLVNPRKKTLMAADVKRISEIQDAVTRLTSRPAEGARAFAYAYIRENFLDRIVLTELAEDVRSAEALLERYRPKRLVVDGVRSRRHLAFVSLAKSGRIAVDYLWHAPMTPQNLKMGALGGDSRQVPMVDRCLSWGRTNETWLERVGAGQPITRIGSPLRERYTGTAAARLATRGGVDRRVLVLQYGFNVLDLAGVNANMYGTFVNVVRLLCRLGYRAIRLKMHPAAGRWPKSQFKNIAAFFGLDCEILMSEPFVECLDWADVVIGPSHTGAMFETLAAGKPYHALMLPPHDTFDRRYFEGFPLVTSLEQLPDALQRDTAAEGRKLLDDLYSIEDVPSPTTRFWQVLDSGIG